MHGSLLRILGVDFTSSPSRRKSITVAHATLEGFELEVEAVRHSQDFVAFEALLNSPGPWVGAFDFPFGLPRELVETLRWPTDWPELVTTVGAMERSAFRSALTSVRESRPMGARYIARRGDAMAGSSSPMKLVNPPVGLMFLEGAPRLLKAGVSVLPCAPRTDPRIALEAYPGYLARKITRASYKKDGKEGMSPDRFQARTTLVDALVSTSAAVSGIAVKLSQNLKANCVADGSGDTLDAVMCAIQAAQSVVAGSLFAIPSAADPLEGWIVTVPDS